MQKFVRRSLVLSLALASYVVLPSGVAQAGNGNDQGQNGNDQGQNDNSQGGGGKKAVPEMSLVAGGAAIALVAGGIVVMGMRHRRKSPAA
ncbi:MAG TPA: hypothetical protein VH475_14790 [Tepidisphaeraceae bacterium]|jgi:hypothetical protein